MPHTIGCRTNGVQAGFGIDADSVMHGRCCRFSGFSQWAAYFSPFSFWFWRLVRRMDSRSPLSSAMAPARGALVDRDRHPEVRQFLILAALKRADELNRLRDLPDTPARSDDATTCQSRGLSRRTNRRRSGRNRADQRDADCQHSDRNWRTVIDRVAAPPRNKRMPRRIAKSRNRLKHRAKFGIAQPIRPRRRVAANTGWRVNRRSSSYLFGGQQYQQTYNTQQYQQPAYNAPQAAQAPAVYAYPVPEPPINGD